MEQLFSLKYWFNMSPGQMAPLLQQALMLAVVTMLALAVITSFLSKRYKKTLYVRIWKSVFNFTLTNGIIGLLILFFTYELIPFLSARFWLLFWAIGWLVWLGFIIRRVTVIPEKKRELERDKEYKKYIP